MTILGGILHPGLDIPLIATAPHEHLHDHHDDDGHGDGRRIEQRTGVGLNSCAHG